MKNVRRCTNFCFHSFSVLNEIVICLINGCAQRSRDCDVWGRSSSIHCFSLTNIQPFLFANLSTIPSQCLLPNLCLSWRHRLHRNRRLCGSKPWTWTVGCDNHGQQGIDVMQISSTSSTVNIRLSGSATKAGTFSWFAHSHTNHTLGAIMFNRKRWFLYHRTVCKTFKQNKYGLFPKRT